MELIQPVLLTVIEDMLRVKKVVHATVNVLADVHVKVKMGQRQGFYSQNKPPKFTEFTLNLRYDHHMLSNRTSIESFQSIVMIRAHIFIQMIPSTS